ncbi:MAG TPA: maleylpyruvate isomerase family mycothiol-dependent enzyme [Micromonosporaceae bacterium]
MTSLADRVIAAVTTEHDTTAALARTLTDEQLTTTSGSAEWTVADVLSHLGSGSVITLAGLQAALGEREQPADDFSQSVWDRWNAMTPAEQRDGFIEHDAALVAALNALDDQQRETLQVSVGFLPFPLAVAPFAGLRLSETTQHGWDVRVAGDKTAELSGESAGVLAALFSTELAFLAGFLGKPDLIAEPVRLDIAESGYGLSITDSIALVSPVDDPTATFSGSIASALRLIAGRLRPEHTPTEVTVTGNITLDQLRTAFPGF